MEERTDVLHGRETDDFASVGMFDGLSPEDLSAALTDLGAFGTAMIFTDAAGAKRRIPPHEWPETLA